MYNRKVLEIYQYRDCVKVVDSENLYYIADVVIVAIPWNRMQDIKFCPPLPQEIQKAPQPADNTNYVITSFLATYKDGHWRTKQFSGKYLSLEPFLVAQEYRCTTICGYYTHEEGLEPLVRSIILHKLSENFGEEMLIPLEYVQHTFELNTMAHVPLTSAWNRVIWSSSAAAGTCFRGHLGGAVQSGIRAAVNALLITRPQLVTWQDIAEIQCHNYLPRRDITGFRRWLSAWNLYDTTMYTLFVGGLVVILCHSYKKLK